MNMPVVRQSDEEEELGFGAKCLVSAALPYRNPNPEKLLNGVWVRRNGDYTLWVQGGPQGLPYGSYPRIFIIWLTTEAVRTGNKRLVTGGNFSDFCRKLNIDCSKGKNGAGKRMVDQVKRLLNSRAAFVSTKDEDTDFLQFTDRYRFFEQREKNEFEFESEIVLTDKFFKEITEHCIPLDLHAVRALQQSAMALDIYQWLAYRMFSLRRPAHPTWKQLAGQFGANYKRMVDFRSFFLESLEMACAHYTTAKVRVEDDGIVLLPSPTAIKTKAK